MDAGAIFASFQLDVSDFKKGIAEVQATTKKSTEKISGLAGRASKALTGMVSSFAVGSLLRSSRKEYVAYKKELNNVATVSNLSGKALDKFGKRFQKLSGSMGKTTDLISGAYQAFSAGAKDAGQAFDITTKAAKFAQGQVTSVSASVDILTTAMNAYGQETIDAGRAADVFATIIRQGKINGDQLSSSIGNSISIFAGANIAIEELAGGVITLTKNGVSSAETMTKLNAVVRELQKPTDNLAAVIKKAGYESGQALLNQKGLAGALDILQEATGGQTDKLWDYLSSSEAVSGATVLLTDNTNIFKESLDAANNSLGNSEEAYKKSISGMEFMQNNFSTILQVIGQGTDGLFRSIGSVVQDLTTAMTSGNFVGTLWDINKSLLGVAVGIAAIGLAAVASGAIGWVAQLTTNFQLLFSVVTSKATAIGAVLLGVGYLAKKVYDAFKEGSVSIEGFLTTTGALTNEQIQEVQRLSATRWEAIKKEGKFSKTQISTINQLRRKYNEYNNAVAAQTAAAYNQNKAAAAQHEKTAKNALNTVNTLKQQLKVNIQLNKEKIQSEGITKRQKEALLGELQAYKSSVNTLHDINGQTNVYQKNLEEQIKWLNENAKVIEDNTKKTDENAESNDILNNLLGEIPKNLKAIPGQLNNIASGLQGWTSENEAFAKSEEQKQRAIEKASRALEIAKIGMSEQEKILVDMQQELDNLKNAYYETGEGSIEAIQTQNQAVEDQKDKIKKLREEAEKEPENPYKQWGKEVKKVFDEAKKTGYNTFDAFGQASKKAVDLLNTHVSKISSTLTTNLGKANDIFQMYTKNQTDKIELENRAQIDSINAKHNEEIASIEAADYEKEALTEYRNEQTQLYEQQKQDALFTGQQEHDLKLQEYNQTRDEKAKEKEIARWQAEQQKIKNEYAYKIEQIKKDDNRASTRQKVQDKAKEIREEKIKEQEKKRRQEIQAQEDKAKKNKNERLKQAFETQKAFQIAETLISIPSAAMSAYSSLAGIPIVGPALGFAAAAAATAFGIARVAMISEQQFVPQAAEGGQVIKSGMVQINEEGGEIRKLSNQELVIPAELSQKIIAGAMADSTETNETIINNEFIINGTNEDIPQIIIETMQEQLSYATV